MKINWGTGVVIGFILFISFIMYFVVTMLTGEQFTHELVAEDYYKKELAFQEEIDLEQKSIDDGMLLSIKKTEKGIKVLIPGNLNTEDIKGTIFLYRPSNERLDFNLPLVVSGDHLLIPDKRLLDGRWNMKVYWEYKGESYLFKKEFTY